MTIRRRWAPTLHVALSAALLALAAGGLAAEGDAAAPSRVLRLEKGAPPGAASISDFAWLTGYWTGTGLGGECEELWMPPMADRMYGTFTLQKEGAIVFSEAVMLVEEEGSVVLKVKHFHPDFVGWEEKEDSVDFRLVKVEQDRAHFSGLTFERSGDSLKIYLLIREGEKVSEQFFDLVRKPL